MTTVEEHIQQLVAEDPQFAQLLAESDAELSLAMQTAAIREGRAMTQQQLAAVTGMRQPAIARYEKAGRTPSLPTLWRFATALNVEFRIGPQYGVDVVPLPGAPLTTETPTGCFGKSPLLTPAGEPPAPTAGKTPARRRRRAKGRTVERPSSQT